MKPVRIVLFLLASVLALSSCETVGYKANCFGPPSPAQVDAGNQMALKMIHTP